MSKVNRGRLKLTIIIAFLLFSPYINEAASISSYSKTWTQPNTSKLEITISSYTINLLVNTAYTYKINFEVIAVSSNLDSFYSIAVCLRFVSVE